jgi:ribosomal protein S18 acetylase RimI-like enzyme
MLRDLAEPIPAVELPEGLEVRPSTPEHTRAIWEAMDEAFRDHWGYSPGTEQDYERFAYHPSNTPEFWQVAWEGEQVAGMVLNRISAEENEKLGLKWGWTDPICVRRPWRKRGLARALIYKSMEVLKTEGMQQAVLGVDTQNPNGALGLYESCGYRQFEHWTIYVKGIDK